MEPEPEPEQPEQPTPPAATSAASKRRAKKARQKANRRARAAATATSSTVSATEVARTAVLERAKLSAIQSVCASFPPENPTLEDLELHLTEDERPFAMLALRCKYQSVSRGDWWWIFEDSLYHIAGQLRDRQNVILDGFFSTPVSADACCSKAYDLGLEIKRKWKDGLLPEQGAVIDATDGRNTPQTKTEVRGDFIGWFEGSEAEGWASQQPGSVRLSRGPERSLPGYIKKVSTLVSELKKYLPEELGGVEDRSRAMVTCYPPGARYTKHVDNGGNTSNGRRLTTLFYLNEDWKAGDGGELAMYEQDDAVRCKVTVEPIADRLVLFWSDVRVPHEVLETHRERFTVTIWFFDEAEWQIARDRGVIPKPTDMDDVGTSRAATAADGAADVECAADNKNSGGTEVPGDSSFSFVSADAPPESREPDGSDLRPVEAALPSFDTSAAMARLSSSAGARADPSRAAADQEPAFTVELVGNLFVAAVELPDVPSMAAVQLDMSERSLELTADQEGRGRLALTLELSHAVDVGEVAAKFSRKKQRLTIKAPLAVY